MVGDDLIVLTTHSDSSFDHHLSLLSKAGFKVSDEDTFISKHLVFYCEETSLIP